MVKAFGEKVPNFKLKELLKKTLTILLLMALTPLKTLQLYILSFGLLFVSLKTKAEDLDVRSTDQDGWVIVEPYTFSEKTASGDFAMMPYKQRRNKWGYEIQIGVSTFEPVNFEPSFSINSYDYIYGGQSGGFPELRFMYKRNLSLMSISAELGIGSFTIESADGVADVSSLNLTPVSVGLRVDLDMFLDEPLFVPYFSTGTYIMLYSETQGATNKSGNTSFSLYWTAGVQIQLDWLDKDSDIISYVESGIENTFFYLEGRQLFASSETIDPNFESSLYLNGGISFEF